jgi:hypothetical protein
MQREMTEIHSAIDEDIDAQVALLKYANHGKGGPS